MGELGGASDTRYDDRDKQMFKIAPTIITVIIIIITAIYIIIIIINLPRMLMKM